MPEMRHTQNLSESRWERFVFKITGRWPQSVVTRRLDAYDQDVLEARIAARRERYEAYERQHRDEV